MATRTSAFTGGLLAAAVGITGLITPGLLASPAHAEPFTNDAQIAADSNAEVVSDADIAEQVEHTQEQAEAVDPASPSPAEISEIAEVHEQTAAVSKSVPANGRPAAAPDFSSQLALMRSISYPIASTGKANPDSWVYGLRRDEEKMYDSYRKARLASKQAHLDVASSRNAPKQSGWADCGAYVATIVKNTVDPHFPWLLTNVQQDYLRDTSNGWVKVGDTHDYRPGDYQTGDVLMGHGHVMLWVGDHDGFTEVVNDASFSRNTEKLTGRMPGFREINLKQGTDSQDGKPAMVDASNRSYEVFRFKKRIASPIGTTDWAKSTASMTFDGVPDLLAVTSAGSLRLYQGDGRDGSFGKFAPFQIIGSGFVNHQIITPGDFDQDGFDDIISVNDSTGIMYLHRGNGSGGFLKRVQIGSGFKTIRNLTSVGDFDGDGNPDLIGIVKSDGRMIMWRGNGKGNWLPKKQIGSGFKNLQIASGGDFQGDGTPDIVSWNPNTGFSYLHSGNGKGGWKKRTTITKTGLKNKLVQSVGDLDRDGYGDLLAIDKKTGVLKLHRGGPHGKLLDVGRQVGTGWQYMRSLS